MDSLGARVSNRATTYWIVGWIASLAAIAFFVGFLPRWLYVWSLSWGAGHLARLSYDLSTLNQYLVGLPLIGWIWGNLPGPTENFIRDFLLTPSVCTAIALAIIGVYLRQTAKRVRDRGFASDGARVHNHRQSVRSVYAGGSVSIHQIVNEKAGSPPSRVALVTALITALSQVLGALIRAWAG